MCSLNTRFESSLTPDQLQVKQQADLLYRRSYNQDKVARTLEKMERRQDPRQPAKVVIQPFVDLVNTLAKSHLTHHGDKLLHLPNDVNILFDNPADRTRHGRPGQLSHVEAQPALPMHRASGKASGRVGVAMAALSHTPSWGQR